ncbi:MAG: 4-(cytidine 5'-diphospho)-2-C-methyl-D-erythritol kinase [Clostridia bacterium]|nr:4-(cytidine 5'-diphospho)-2-C-methyl-D-erythritol kinase [Clostridia bacterium]
MLHEYEMTANAKINLFLKICGTLPHGYHELSTVMQEIALGDEINVSINDEENFKIVLNCSSDIPPYKNLCYKAADLYAKEYAHKTGSPLNFSVSIDLEKKVPSEAGMGGGSSDAACILLILNEHCNNFFSISQLNKLAARLGADVPFFLYGKTQYCRGVGEKITPLNSLEGINIVIVKPAEGVPTAECFSRFDSQGSMFVGDKIDSILAVINSDESAAERLQKTAIYLENDLQPIAASIVPAINDVLSAIKDNQAIVTMMCGSGSACYGLFDNKQSAMAAAGKLHNDERTKDCSIFVTEFI